MKNGKKHLIDYNRRTVFILVVYFSFNERLHGNLFGKSALVVQVDNYGVCSSVAGFTPGFVLRIGFLVVFPMTHFLTHILGGVLRGYRHGNVFADFFRVRCFAVPWRILRVSLPEFGFLDTRATPTLILRTDSWTNVELCVCSQIVLRVKLISILNSWERISTSNFWFTANLISPDDFRAVCFIMRLFFFFFLVLLRSNFFFLLFITYK